MNPPIRRVGVVVPAHNEEEHIADCLDALMEAVTTVAVPVMVVVVLDYCSDRTAAICARYPVVTVPVRLRNVGRVRHAGAMLALGATRDVSTVWLANTDADTVVPPDWLIAQLRLADRGADVVAGLVTLSDVPRTASLANKFSADYRRKLDASGSHSHVHGANLGVRASAYLATGGFPPLDAHEDRRLLDRLEGDPTATVIRSSKIVVRTSGRLSGRCPEGFATTLRRLATMPAFSER